MLPTFWKILLRSQLPSNSKAGSWQNSRCRWQKKIAIRVAAGPPTCGQRLVRACWDKRNFHIHFVFLQRWFADRSDSCSLGPAFPTSLAGCSRAAFCHWNLVKANRKKNIWETHTITKRKPWVNLEFQKNGTLGNSLSQGNFDNGPCLGLLVARLNFLHFWPDLLRKYWNNQPKLFPANFMAKPNMSLCWSTGDVARWVHPLPFCTAWWRWLAENSRKKWLRKGGRQWLNKDNSKKKSSCCVFSKAVAGTTH